MEEVLKLFAKWWNQKWKKSIIGDTFFDFTTHLAFHVGLCVWSTFWLLFHQAISSLSIDLDSLGHGGGFKTICKVMGPEMKKKDIIGDTFLDFTTYLAFHVSLCVWSTFSPPSHQAISNVSTDLDSLGQNRGFKTICKVMGPEMKKKYWRHFF